MRKLAGENSREVEIDSDRCNITNQNNPQGFEQFISVHEKFSFIFFLMEHSHRSKKYS